jgi:hypothetical protein
MYTLVVVVVVVGGVGCWGYYFFRIHVKEVIEFFCNVGGSTFCLVVN